MFILSFFHEVDVGLVTDEQFMASIAKTDVGGIDLVTVADLNAMKGPSDHGSD